MNPSPKRILLIEDKSEYYEDIIRWLTTAGYQVVHAQAIDSAFRLLEGEHVHVVVTDLHLDNPLDNPLAINHGKQLIETMRSNPRYSDLPIIVVTAYPEVDDLLDMFHELRIYGYVIKKPSYRDKLLQYVNDAFSERVKLNFGLDYRGTETLIPEVAADVQSDVTKKTEVSSERLEPQVRDVLGRLFYEADGINLEKLNPGLTGAAILRVDAHWRGIGWGPQCVAKIGRRDKISRENERYNKYVRNHLHNNVPANIAVEYSYDIGGVLYRLAEGNSGPLREFDNFYERRSAHDINICLERVFGETCYFWYDHPDEADYINLPEQYFDAFNLTFDRLVEAADDLLPGFNPKQSILKFPGAEKPILNPIYWLAQHQSEYRLRVSQCTTHGDLTGRNMMVDPDAHESAIQCWLIDFYRTGKSHMLRDFAILETDITYRLWATPHLSDFLQVAVMLNENAFKGSVTDDPVESEAQKAYRVLASLRALGMSLSRGARETELSRKAYWMSLLMATLNVIRLRHIPLEQKCQALVAANLFCKQLDLIAHRKHETLELAGVEALSHAETDVKAQP